MREKVRRIRRRPVRHKVRTEGMSTADWLLVNEAGWGVPHGWLAAFAGVVVGVRALGYEVGRLVVRLARFRGRTRS